MGQEAGTLSLRNATATALRMNGVALLSHPQAFVSQLLSLTDTDLPEHPHLIQQIDEEILQPLVAAVSDPIPSTLLGARSQIVEILTKERGVTPGYSRTFANGLVGGLVDYLGVDMDFIYCMHCGTRLPYDTQFCPSCGTLVSYEKIVGEPMPLRPPVKDSPTPEGAPEDQFVALASDEEENRPVSPPESSSADGPSPSERILFFLHKKNPLHRRNQKTP